MASFSSSPATSSAVESPFPMNANGIPNSSAQSTSNHVLSSIASMTDTTNMSSEPTISSSEQLLSKSQPLSSNTSLQIGDNINSPNGITNSSTMNPSSHPGTAPLTPISTTVEQNVTAEGQSKQRMQSNDAGLSTTNGRIGDTGGRDYVQNDVDQLQDVLGSSGVDLRAEENAMYRRDFTNETQNSIQQARDAEEARLRSFYLELHPLSHRIHKIARANDLSVDSEVLQHLSIATKMRFHNLLESMIAASRHRQWSSHLRTPPMYEFGKSSAMYHEEIHDDPRKILTVLGRVEQAHEQAARQRRLQREEQEAILASANHHDEDGNDNANVNNTITNGSQPSSLNSNGQTNTTQTSADGTSTNLATSSQDDAKRKTKKQPGISAAARNMTDDKRLKLANKTAAQAMGLSAGSKAWMFGGGTLPKNSSKLAGGKAGSLPAPRFGGKTSNSTQNSSLKDEKFSENGGFQTTVGNGGTTSHEKNDSVTINPGGWGDLAARQRHREEEERRKVRLVNLEDAMHALEMEHKGGAGRGSGIRTLYVTRALGRPTIPMHENI